MLADPKSFCELLNPTVGVGEIGGSVRYPEVDASPVMGSSGEIVRKEGIVDDTIFVAVGKEVKDSESTLIWALQNSKGKKICIIYVHMPAKTVPMSMGGKFPANKVGKKILEAFRDKEQKEMFSLLDFYVQICAKVGVRAEKIHIEMDSTIEEGIVELISQHGIGKLVMGAAVDRSYSRKMVEPKSRKANYVRDHAPDYCHILFVCKNCLIYTREPITPTEALQVNLPDLQGSVSSGSSGSPLRSSVSNDAQDQNLESSPPVVSSIKDNHYDQLEHAMIEAENARREAFEESMRRHKAEKEAETSERLYYEQLRLRKATEEELAKGKEELENKNVSVKGLEEKLLSAVDLLQKFQIERDIAVRQAEDLRNQLGQAPSNTHVPIFFSEFSFSDLEKATNHFDPSLKIGEGGYGSIYKGFLRHTEVAIKILNPNSMQGPREFNQEVDVLSKLRHPNLVTLVGACPESWALVYEYLSGGSLEERIACKGNAPPLPWQTRIRIATELCSALIFLHSSQPSCIIHGDLKPANVLLDNNGICKLGDFGICRVVTSRETSIEQTAAVFTDEPKGTLLYMDPGFVLTGELTPKADVYSFGIILLRLLTGKSALRISKEVELALAKGTLDSILDPLAGDWPFVQAEQLVHVALRCCDMNRKNRPDLCSDVLSVLESLMPKLIRATTSV